MPAGAHECYCSPQAAMAACIRNATGLDASVAAFDRAGAVSLPYVTIESTGDGDLSRYYGGSTERSESVVSAHACSGDEAMQLISQIRESLARCSHFTMAGFMRVVRLSHSRLALGEEQGEHVATLRVTHLTTRNDSHAPQP